MNINEVNRIIDAIIIGPTMYRVYIIDKFSQMPLTFHEVHAWTKWGAKRKVFKWVCERDNSYILVASRVK